MKISYLTVSILIIGIMFRFYNLMWGAPFFFHPDERNIVYAVQRLNFPNQLNPHFFAYGSLPLYVIYFTGVLWNYISFFLHLGKTFIPLTSISFGDTIFFGRLYSAVFSFLLILLLQKIGKKICRNVYSELLLVITATSVGFIQFAHFATFEMWLTFFSALFFYFVIRYVKNKKKIDFVFFSIIFGLLLSIKISSLTLLPIILLLPVFTYQRRRRRKEQKKIYIFLQTVRSCMGNMLLFILIAGIICLITSPYYVLDFSSFRSGIQYEADVATGALLVFYTGQFFNTIPVLYQLEHVFPFLLNPLLTMLFIPSLGYFIYVACKKKNQSYFLLLTSYFLLFLPQAFLFVKWTRYMIPLLPFMYLIIFIALSDFLKAFQKKKDFFYIRKLVIYAVTSTSIIFAFSYLITVHMHTDTRSTASTWAHEHIPNNAIILSEIYDMGIVPFNQYFTNITLFNFYDLDNDPQNSLSKDLEEKIKHSEYIILPSQRIMKNRLLNKNKFPIGNAFYTNLFSEKLGFKKIYETPCDIFCKITYMGNPIFTTEETASVFDRPTVYIFKKR